MNTDSVLLCPYFIAGLRLWPHRKTLEIFG